MSAIGPKSFQIRTAATIKRGQPDAAMGSFAILAFYGLLVTILLFSIPYGTVEVWHKSLLVLMICIFGGSRVIDSVLTGSFRVAEPLMLLPLVAVLGIAVIQIVPWSGVASVISVDPYETKAFILIFGGLLIAGEVLLFYTNTPHRLKFLIGLVIIVGAGSAVFGILHDVFVGTQSDSLVGVRAEQGYAQFINRNHFALLMEMALGLLLGLLIKGKHSEKFKFFGWVLAGIMTYSVITANSRGGIISLAALSLFAVFAYTITRDNPLARDREHSGRIPAGNRITGRKILAAVGLCCLVFGLIVASIAFVGGDRVVTRIEKLPGEVEMVDKTRGNRSSIWRSTIELIKDKPILGAGFGGYAAAITKYDRSGGIFSLEQAHNDYLEILANGGIVGFALFAGFAALVVIRILKNLKSRDALTRSCCFGAAIGIFGVLIHSFVDFGLHILINALIFTVLVVIATAKVGEATENRASSF